MLRAILFDLGGTLDSDGVDWLSRFQKFYDEANARISRAEVRSAFDHAERRAAADETMTSAGLDQMLARHVAWQFELLQPSEAANLGSRIVARFASDVRQAAANHVALLAQLHARGLQLGVVSNGCGNVETLCRELGFAPFLSVIVDSSRVGVAKPSPRIYSLAAQRLSLAATTVMMVGDSFERDIAPAKTVGMRTAWVTGSRDRLCPDPDVVDVQLRSLADLPMALASEVTIA